MNQVNIIGNLGRDPELRHVGNANTAVTELSVATSEKWTDKKTGEVKEETEWHKVVLWGRQAEIAAEYLSKGSKARFTGRIKTEKWQDKETGADRYTTKIIAKELQFLDSKREQRPKQSEHDYGPPAMDSEEVPF